MFEGRITDIFFDLDHTLWDFDRNSYLTFEKILAENGLAIDPDEFIAVYAPINLMYWKRYRENKIAKPQLRYLRLKNTFDSLGRPVSDETIHLLSDQYIEQLTGYNHLMANTTTILEYLQPKYSLHIITNGFEEVQQKKLSNSGISGYFKQVVNSEMAGVKKPHPHIFKLALKRARTNPANALMIGDNLEADILGARALGINTLHFDPHAREDHTHGKIITDLIEIKSLL